MCSIFFSVILLKIKEILFKDRLIALKMGLPLPKSRPRLPPPINPWIYDFAAYDYFARPLGLLYLAGWLRAQGSEVHLLDCLDVPHARPGPFGTGRYPKEIIPTPAALADIPRRYGRYGISEADFRERLARVPTPAAILVTSLMTYWYPGVTAAIRLVREHFPDVPVILGGIYATLCPEHAREHSGADRVVAGPGRSGHWPSSGGDHRLVAAGGDCSRPRHLDSRPYPALDLLEHPSYIPILTSRGCPLDCAYCASRLLQPVYRRRDPLAAVAELVYWQDRTGLADAAFYDDALLLGAVRPPPGDPGGTGPAAAAPSGSIPPTASMPASSPGRWRGGSSGPTSPPCAWEWKPPPWERPAWTPNSRRGNWKPPWPIFRRPGSPRRPSASTSSSACPDQAEAEVAASVLRVKELGATPVLASYSPIPGTALWPRAVATSRFDLAADPLFHNNSLFPCWPEFSWDRYTRLKRLAAG